MAPAQMLSEQARERQRKVLESVSPSGQALLGKEGVDFPHSFHFLGLPWFAAQAKKRRKREGVGPVCLETRNHRGNHVVIHLARSLVPSFRSTRSRSHQTQGDSHGHGGISNPIDARSQNTKTRGRRNTREGRREKCRKVHELIGFQAKWWC